MKGQALPPKNKKRGGGGDCTLLIPPTILLFSEKHVQKKHLFHIALKQGCSPDVIDLLNDWSVHESNA